MHIGDFVVSDDTAALAVLARLRRLDPEIVAQFKRDLRGFELGTLTWKEGETK